MAEYGISHKEILLKKEKELDYKYQETKGRRGSTDKLFRCELVHSYQSPCTQEEWPLLSSVQCIVCSTAYV